MTKPIDNTKTVTLSTPILRGETEITEITVRKPNVPALKGLKPSFCTICPTFTFAQSSSLFFKLPF